MNIIFMGSAQFAVPCLDALVKSQHKIIEVITQPDKPSGRGLEIHSCPIATYAKSCGLNIYQPKSIRKAEAIDHIAKLSPDLICVVAYGKILPGELLAIPKLGCINVHGSLLPKYRGAAPINWAIANGERVSGVTTMYMNEGMDEGDMLLAGSIPIGPDETAIELHDRLAPLGASLLIETLDGMIAGSVQRIRQDPALATYAPIINKGDGRIDWKLDAQVIYNRIRAFTPWPGSFTTLSGKLLRIHSARLVPNCAGELPGHVIETSEKIIVSCGVGAIDIRELQMEGKRRMNAKDFICGHKLKIGTVFL